MNETAQNGVLVGLAEAGNVIVTGIGGQGNVLAARLLGAALLGRGYDVAVGDVFGLSQRGGAVTSHVRFKAGSLPPPLVPRGALDLLVAFEPLEALRVLCEFGGPATRLMVSERVVPTLGSAMGRTSYPDLGSLWADLRRLSAGVTRVDGRALALKAGDPRAMNVVMVGVAVGSGLLPLQEDDVQIQLERLLPSRLLEVNRRALSLGASAAAEML